MAAISEIKVTGPVLYVTFEDGQVLSTESQHVATDDLLGKNLSQIHHDSFALDWLHIQYEAARQGLKPLTFLAKNHAPAAQTTSYIGQLCAMTQNKLDKAASDICLIDISCDVSETNLKNLRLGRGQFLRLKLIGQWKHDQIFNFLNTLKGLPIDCVELPLEIFDKTFQQRSLIPLATRLESHMVEDFLKIKPTNRVHLDPVLLGGVTKTLDIAFQAKALFLDPIITAPALSTFSMRACINLARAIDLHGHFVHNLDQTIVIEGVPSLQIQAGWLID